MTYKKIVYGLIERDSQRWLEKLLDENGIEYLYTSIKDVSTEARKNKMLGRYYHCNIRITLDYLTDKTVQIGGVIDEYGVYHSVIRDPDDIMKIYWMAVEDTRKELGITEFKLD